MLSLGRTQALFRSIYNLDVMDLSISMALDLLKEITNIIALKSAYVEGKFINNYVSSIFPKTEVKKEKLDDNSIRMRDAIKRLKAKTGKNKFTWDEVDKEMRKDNKG